MSDLKSITRREFLRDAAIAGAGAAAAGLLGAVPAAAQVPAKWDKEVDVVIVGSGTAVGAALPAADAGASVLILEKSKVFGGTTAMSGGGMWVPNNYVMQAEGVKDSKEEAFKYMKVVVEGQASDELINQYLDKAPEMALYLRDKAGMPMVRSSKQYADYYPTVEGAHTGDNIRTLYPKPKGDEKVPGWWGPTLYVYLKDALAARKVEIQLETPAKRLVVNEKGEVFGVIAEAQGKEIAIKAKRGVLLGTGGFDYNADMRTAFLRAPIYYSVAAAGCTGDGHLMGMAVGAALGNMNSNWGLPGYPLNPDSFGYGDQDPGIYRTKPGAVIVNKHGERFMNESAMYAPAARAFYHYDTGRYEFRNLPGFVLFDSGYTTRYPLPGGGNLVGTVPKTFAQADTLEALAKALGIDPEGLKNTLARFNANAKNGVDPDWHRGEASNDRVTGGDRKRTDIKNACLAPLETPPFYGRTIFPGTFGTNGGLKTNVNAQVLNVWGQVIPGLYATGNTMASVMGAAYPGGGATLGAGFTFAYIAGQHMGAAKSRA